jgi:two-component system, sensor histidine kinase ChiS
VAVAVCSPALAADVVLCRKPSATPQTLAEAAVCPHKFGIAVPAEDARYAEAAQLLYDHVDLNIKNGEFNRAASALDCADAVIAGHPDWPLRYELVRRRGILAYREDRVVEALGGFECALELARHHGDRPAIAKQLKNIGSALRRLGDFRGALKALSLSLDMQRMDGSEETGAVLNNIADVYRELGDPDQASRYYREALDAFRAQHDRSEAAHVLETMSLLAMDRGDTVQAERLLTEALDTYRETGDEFYQLRVDSDLARLAISRGDLSRADTLTSAGIALAREHGLPVPWFLVLQRARVDRMQGRPEIAILQLRRAMGEVANSPAERIALLEELSLDLEAVGDSGGAIRALRDVRSEDQALSKAREDRQLAWLRARFETAERDRTIAMLEKDNRLRRAMLRQRTLWLWLTAVSALAGLLVLLIGFQRRQQRTRLAEAERQVRHDEELARYRREADALAEDRNLLQGLLDSRDEALCLVDAEGTVFAANRAACALLGTNHAEVTGSALSSHLREADMPLLAAVLEKMEDESSQTTSFARRDGSLGFNAKLAQWERGDGLILLNLHVAATPSTEQGHAFVDDAAQPDSPVEHGDARAAFRRSLVELMLAVVDAWERGSGLNRLELAERSRIWRVTIDDGRLRARAMERYLTLSKLPQNPRWRDVLRSAYFVLAQCQLDSDLREDLRRQIDVVLGYTRRSALV